MLGRRVQGLINGLGLRVEGLGVALLGVVFQGWKV